MGRHKGQGLPYKGPVPWMLLAVAIFVSVIRNTFDLNSLSAGLTFGLVGGILIYLVCKSRPTLIAPIALISCGGDLIAIAIQLIGYPRITLLITVWQIAALVIYLRNTGQNPV